MIYVARGPHRSGSTLAYEIMVDIGKAYSAVIGRMVSEKTIYDAAASPSVSVVKSHTFNFKKHTPGIKLVYTDRCPFSRVASAMRMPKRFPDIEAFIEGITDLYLKEREWLVDHPYVLVLPYHTGVGSEGVKRWIYQIEVFMGMRSEDPKALAERLNPSRLQEISKLSLEEIRGTHGETALWENHVGPCSEDIHAWELPPRLEAQVREILPDHSCEECTQ